MHEFWTIPAMNMTYTSLQNYTNMMVDRHGIQTFEVMIVMLLVLLLSSDAFLFPSAHPLLFIDKRFVQIIYLNANFVQYHHVHCFLKYVDFFLHYFC